MEKRVFEPFWYFLYYDGDICTSDKYSTYEECYTDWKNTHIKIGYPMMGYNPKELNIPKVGS